MTKPRLARASFGCGGALLALLILLCGCGREAPQQAPPQNGKPSEPAPAQPEQKAEEQSSSPSMLEQDRAPEPAPAAAPFAPPPPATPAAKPAKPAATRAREAAPTAARRPRAESNDGMDWSAEPQVLRQRLDDAVKLSTPDCPSARERKQAICDLANQICQLVDRDPDVASVESYCDDAKQRCSEAERRTAQRCR